MYSDPRKGSVKMSGVQSWLTFACDATLHGGTNKQEI
jgi:hypothetical protein